MTAVQFVLNLKINFISFRLFYFLIWKNLMLLKSHALYDEHEVSKKQKRDKIKRRHWIYPLNLKRPENGQFQVTFMTLRSYPEEFIKYYRMSITSFDELISLVRPKLSKQHTVLRMPISPEERLTVTLR